MNAWLLAAVLLQSGSDAGRIGVQHEGRVKPLDTLARQLLQFLTEREDFRGYQDPATGERVEVFRDGGPVASVLGLVARAREVRGLRFLKITHPELKERFGLDPERKYFSLEDLEPSRERMLEDAREIDEETATSRDRALLKVLNQLMTLESLHEERLLTIFPVPYGENRSWVTPGQLRAWLDGRAGQAAFAPALEADGRREALRSALDRYDRAMEGLARGDASAFADLAGELRALNPSAFPSERRTAAELHYNRARPFHWASGVYFLASLAFLLALAFRSRKAWAAAMLLHTAALALTGYGYTLRWIVAGRYPLSNHYESMVMCALGAALLVPILELSMRSKSLLGLAGSLVASLLLVLANNVPAFAEQGFVAPLVPALQTVWMTLHVPVIMTGYALAMLLMVLGHVYLVRVLARRLPPEAEKTLDGILHRVLQLTVLFLLLGIVLGAVWAGEAWGRPWGWDMKETWSLITLLSYLAILHARFLGAVRGFGTAVGSLAAFQILVLTYYGVNFVFGKGLHTYGFGAGEMWPLVGFFAVEGAFAAAVAALRPRPVLQKAGA